MAREVDILGYLPPILLEIKELKAIAGVENPILEKLWRMIDATLNNQFIITADENGIGRYEKMLGLQVSDSDTLETRIFRVLARYQEQAPYTYRTLKLILDSLLGTGNYTMERNVEEKWLTVKIELTVKRQFEVVEDTLERMVPQNMILTVELRFNQWSKIKLKTWGELLSKTWRDVKEEVL
ncbi:putative phage tail protein [Metasolibacillus sp.]|uniref:putative phage tail protein n=1 Tax=Metasolibacillus sp. TaxID=2703680 RepID=UPI0025F180E7|nr:putative phage tail protein [Metasolibacillus sp.]MCT6924111.1 YmfQ family protein [Metasolibacillus sp.]MCT6940218.1 YmfQ family protein [Metasolibacillus sp.]